MNLRVKLSAIGLCVFTVLHLRAAVSWALADLPAGLWLMLLFQGGGCALGAYGLLRNRSWARGLAVAIGFAALTQISALCGMVLWGGLKLDGGLPIASGTLQWLACAAMIIALSGSAMRRRFEERPGSPWDFENKLTRVVRTASIMAIVSVPMLLSMAAYAVYATRGHTLSVVGAMGMMLAVFMLLRQRSAGLFVLLISAITAGAGTVLVLTSLDTNPHFASQSIYLSRTVAAAAALLPGIAFATITFALFLPRVLRRIRHSE